TAGLQCFGQEPRTLGRVLPMCGAERCSKRGIGLGPFVQPCDPSLGLHARDGLHGCRTREPVESGKRPSLRVDGVVPDDERMTFGASCDDAEPRVWLAADLAS